MSLRGTRIIDGMAMFHALAQSSDVPIPRSTDWVPVLLLTLLWIFVAAALAGAILRYVRPRSRAS